MSAFLFQGLVMPKLSQKILNSPAFIRPWGADDNYNAALLDGYSLYIQQPDVAEHLDPGVYTFNIAAEGKSYSSFSPQIFELRIFNGTWKSKLIGVYESCYSERGYKFNYEYVGGLYRPIIHISFTAAVKDTHILQVQWLYHHAETVSASPISTLAVAKPIVRNENTFLWQTRYTEGFGIAQRIHYSYSRIGSQCHYSSQSNFPCGGRSFYQIDNHTTTDDIVQKQLQLFDNNKVRILDLGTANGQLLIHLQRKFNLNWSQLLGISAQDYRKFNRIEVPNKSYLCYNIEDLYQIKDSLSLFSLILSEMTWFYLADPLGSLEIAYNLLTINGEMYISFNKELATQLFIGKNEEQNSDDASLTSFVDLLNSTKLCQAKFINKSSIIKNSCGWLNIKRNSPEPLSLAAYIKYAPPLAESDKSNSKEIRRFTQYCFFSPMQKKSAVQIDDHNQINEVIGHSTP